MSRRRRRETSVPDLLIIVVCMYLDEEVIDELTPTLRGECLILLIICVCVYLGSGSICLCSPFSLGNGSDRFDRSRKIVEGRNSSSLLGGECAWINYGLIARDPDLVRLQIESEALESGVKNLQPRVARR